MGAKTVRLDRKAPTPIPGSRRTKRVHALRIGSNWVGKRKVPTAANQLFEDLRPCFLTSRHPAPPASSADDDIKGPKIMNSSLLLSGAHGLEKPDKPA